MAWRCARCSQWSQDCFCKPWSELTKEPCPHCGLDSEVVGGRVVCLRADCVARRRSAE